MFYGAYKGIRDGAWRCLKDFKFNALPIDILRIAQESNIKVIKNSDVDILSFDENGRSLFDGNQWYIVYNDNCTVEDARFTIAHELGHVFLGHPMQRTKYGGVNSFESKPQAEKQADMFATRILSPMCVLHEIGVSSAIEIAQYCRIPVDVAKKRWSRMLVLNERNRYFDNKLELEVYAGFEDFVRRECYKKSRQA